MPPLLLFDIDLTLIATSGAGRTALDRAFEQVIAIPDATSGVSFDGRTDRAIILEVLARHAKSTDHFDHVRSAFLQALPHALAEKGGEILPGVEPLLDALAAELPAIGLATGNFREGARHKLTHFGLWERFAAGGFGDHHTERVDVIRTGIQALANAIGVDPNPADAVVIGDTPLDVAAALAAGARPIGVATGRFTQAQLAAAGAVAVLPSLHPLDRAFAVLLDHTP
ncbi:HAD hydrolase-like protein [Tepidiforma sp.]|uniref:HAD hydrolase-like protein n=1 Tax=Tepidiforma sp. TaxID=2682230 RepID=UPI002ADE5971|nr:HAD hydrolase-like protein [Tepidiforma sp.]